MKTKKQNFFKYAAIVFVISMFFVVTHAIKASSSDNVSGWSWGASDDGAGNATGVGWISTNNTNTAGLVSYGLNIPQTDGIIFGYAWSENIGWISFNDGSAGGTNDLTGCPSGTCNAQRVGNNLIGWARIMSIPQAGANAGGWLGWIKLNGTNYGVVMNADGTITNGQATSYAWSDELGWINLAPMVNLPAKPTHIDMQIPLLLSVSVGMAGTVISSVPDATFSCSAATCSKNYPEGTLVTLNVVIQPGNHFVGWSGACSGTATSCSVTMDAAKTVVASVALDPVCGNGILELNEECDLGVNNGIDNCPTPSCAADCTKKVCPPTTGSDAGTWKEVAP